MKRYILLLLSLLAFSLTSYAQQRTKQILKKNVINHFYTCLLPDMLDSISMQFRLPMFYDRDELKKMNVANHFFEESLLDVLKYVCKQNQLQYWIENDGTIYILQNPDDLPHLKTLKQVRNSQALIKPIALPEPKGPPKRYRFDITGKVIDANTGEALPGATVKIRHTTINTLTNTSGNFTILNVPSDTVAVDVSFVGYQPDAFRLNSKSMDSALVLSLFPSMNSLNEVTITGKKSGVLNTDSKQVSVLQLSPAALDKLPNIGERDIMRAFQLMPGVSATNESSSGAYVRGGTPDQNLVTLDGFTVYQVDHLYGFFSAFNANAIRDVDLLKGGYSAKYGGRLSSVTDIRGKEGNKNETTFGGDISLLSTNAYLETPVGKNSSLLIAVRRSYQGPLYDKIFNKFNTSVATTAPAGRFGGRGGPGGFANQVTPSSYFYDVNAKYTYALSSRNSLSLSFYNGSDYLDNGRTSNLESLTTGSSTILKVNDNLQTGNTGSSLKWGSTLGSKIFVNTTLSYSGFYSTRNRGTTANLTDSGYTKNLANTTLEKNTLRDISLKSDWEVRSTDKVKWLFGGFASALHIVYNYNLDTARLIDQNNKGTTGGGYTELQLDPNAKWHIQPGFRATYYSPTGKAYTEPRLSFIYHLTDRINLKGATGRFYQFTDQVIREDVTGGNRNFWVLGNSSTIPVGSAYHYIAGFNYETDAFLFDVEGYYKSLNGLTQYSIRQEGGAGGGPGIPANNGTTTITENFYQGSGFADGVEFLLQKKAGMYTGWLSYTLGQAKNKFSVYGNDYYASDQDIRHEFKSINMYHWQRWSFAAVFIFSTGHPYTAPVGTYTVQTLDGNKTTYLTISGKNTERLPDYHRLDLSATYDILKIDGIKTGSIGLSLFNVYNHVNTWYNEYYIRNNQVYTTVVKYLGFTPNITLSLKWK